MYQVVTVREAIKRGNRIVNFPVLIIMAGVALFSFFLGSQFKFPAWTSAIAVLACVILPWIYWSFMITKWRIWAFENVRNVHELKKKAIEEKLIWPDGSFWEKTEIRTKADRDKIAVLEIKFEQPDVFADDNNLPGETVVRYSKVQSYGLLCLGLVFVVAGLYLIAQNTYLVGGLGILCACYMCFTGYKNGSNNTPQIIINDKGIETYRTPFQPWPAIKNEDIITEGSGKSKTFYFVYQYPDGDEKLPIAEYDIGRRELENLLHVYRIRGSKSHHHRIDTEH